MPSRRRVGPRSTTGNRVSPRLGHLVDHDPQGIVGVDEDRLAAQDVAELCGAIAGPLHDMTLQIDARHDPDEFHVGV